METIGLSGSSAVATMRLLRSPASGCAETEDVSRVSEALQLEAASTSDPGAAPQN